MIRSRTVTFNYRTLHDGLRDSVHKRRPLFGNFTHLRSLHEASTHFLRCVCRNEMLVGICFEIFDEFIRYLKTTTIVGRLTETVN